LAERKVQALGSAELDFSYAFQWSKKLINKYQISSCSLKNQTRSVCYQCSILNKSTAQRRLPPLANITPLLKGKPVVRVTQLTWGTSLTDTVSMSMLGKDFVVQGSRLAKD